MFTSLPGTTIVWRISLPLRNCCTRGDALARATSSSSDSSTDTSTRSRTRPFTCSTSSNVSRRSWPSSATGHGCAQGRSWRGAGAPPRLLPPPLLPERRPQFLRDVRRVRLDQRDRGLGGEARARRGRIAPELVDQLHHRRNRRVEDEAAADVVGHLRDRLVRLSH